MADVFWLSVYALGAVVCLSLSVVLIVLTALFVRGAWRAPTSPGRYRFPHVVPVEERRN